MNQNQKGQDRVSSKIVQAVAYARVSSKEQDKEGFSIAAQQKSLQGYAASHGMVVAQEFIDIETAKATGRTNFEAMLAYLKRHTQVRIVLVEKTDRLYRNLKDWVRLDEFDIEIHLVKEGEVLSKDSRSSAKFMHGIKVLMAKNYIDNLSEEARKGQQEKAEQGIWPTKAPLGYLNMVGPDGKRIIAPDPNLAPVITKLFEWFATGTVSLKEVAHKAASLGLIYRHSGKPLPTSGIHHILRTRLYTGTFEWNGQLCQGRHAPLVTHELWERVQAVLFERNTKKPKADTREFAFKGLITCGHCGSALTAERKKGVYVYYHCTGYRGKCPEPFVREEVLSERFSDVLGRLSFGDEVLRSITKALRESHVDERKEHEAAIARLQAVYDRLQDRIHATYADKLDGTIDIALFEKASASWRAEQARCLREIAWHQSADQSYLEEGAKLLDLAHSARKLFAKQQPHEKRNLLNFVLSNSTWRGGELTPTFRQPFDLLAETTAVAAQTSAKYSRNPSEHPSWLGD